MLWSCSKQQWNHIGGESLITFSSDFYECLPHSTPFSCWLHSWDKSCSFPWSGSTRKWFSMNSTKFSPRFGIIATRIRRQWMSFKMLWVWDDLTIDYTNFKMTFFQLKCCGNNGRYDYFQQSFRKSCCAKDKLTNEECHFQNAYTTGCKQAFQIFWKYNIEMIKFAGVAIGIFELIGIVFSCIMATSLRRGNKTKTGLPPRINVVCHQG